MHSVTEFTKTEESVIVSRVLLLVHAEIDRSFPNKTPAPKQFRKTVFSESDSTALNQEAEEDSPTLINRIIPPPPPPRSVGNDEPVVPRSDLNLLDTPTSGEPRPSSKGPKSIPKGPPPVSQFPEFSRLEENPYLKDRRRRRILLIVIFALLILGLAYLGGAFKFLTDSPIKDSSSQPPRMPVEQSSPPSPP